MSKESLFDRRKRRNRFRIKQRAGGRVRLSVKRSNKHIYAQLIDDSKGVTLATASTMDKEVAKKNGIDAAIAVGELIASRGKTAKVTDAIVFDRGAYLYHGRVKALADAARKAGLTF